MLRESGLLPEDRPDWDTVRRGGSRPASGAMGKSDARGPPFVDPGKLRIMIRSNQHPLTDGAGMTKQILAIVVTFGVAVATVTSALALDGLNESAAQQPVAPPPPPLKTVIKAEVAVVKPARPERPWSSRCGCSGPRRRPGPSRGSGPPRRP